MKVFLNRLFYVLKPLIPRRLQLFVRRIITLNKLKKYEYQWPIDPKSARPPLWWRGWRDDKKFALVLTHDVDTAEGQGKCKNLIKIEKELGFRSSFNFVPERYNVSDDLRNYLINNDFEVGVHGLTHDGKLFSSEKVFNERASQINKYLKEWDAVGFRSPAMHHNLDWINALNIQYDASTFDTDPFEPQPDGFGTIFPFWVKGSAPYSGYVELPYTLAQDHLLFIILREKNINIWTKKADWIIEKGGMILLNVHPDYMNFGINRCKVEEYPARFYEEFLLYIKRKYKGEYWNVLPMDLATFFIEEMTEKSNK